MIKVLNKAFGLLEYIAGQAGLPVLPTEAARALGLNQATAVRILRELLEMGYLSQISRNKGYVLGPMTHSVFMRNTYQQRLIPMAAPAVEQCAATTGGAVVFAVMQGGRRYVLLMENRNPRLKIELRDLYLKDLYFTATGRVLLAYADEKTQADVMRRFGLPQKQVWAEAATRAGFSAALAQIRRCGYAAFPSVHTDFFVMAVPVMEKERCVAALGLSFLKGDYSKARCAKALAALCQAAAEITQKLTVWPPMG